ncbi:hypothetical protein CIHG_07235 [Coccidioides immitis H538.4]|uniref:Uncharacterized protein n=1 Tax=Coccidioides immitis H538.4 TaxID=396776 RepID=A0A0J8RZ35_COCIT|nr:hypothetical protein CIHG_07235 [Coccidioides immitis H538.4]
MGPINIDVNKEQANNNCGDKYSTTLNSRAKAIKRRHNERVLGESIGPAGDGYQRHLNCCEDSGPNISMLKLDIFPKVGMKLPPLTHRARTPYLSQHLQQARVRA